MRPIHRVPTFIALSLTLLSACDFDPNRLRAKPDATASAPDLAPPVDTGSVDPRTGGRLATGGNPGTGGTIGTGGALATGGSLRTGGVLNTGGVATTGGIVASGGLPRTGGITITGGIIPATGGQLVVTGGSTATGGVLVTTGGAVTPPSGNTVSFLNGKALGALMGYAWIAVPSAPTISDPTCGPDKTAITSAGCSTFVNWSAADKICISSFLPALPVDAVTADYDINWGISVGLNVTETGDTGLGQAFSSITLAVTGSSTIGLRAIVHKKGEASNITYCAALTPGTAIPLTSFVTDCYNNVPTGTRITSADVPNINQVMLQVPSKTSAITVSNLCITGITFTK